MRLRTKLKVIRWWERYYDFWQKWRENSRWDYDDRRWVNIVGTLRDLIYFSFAPLEHLRKYRFNSNRLRRVKGRTRTTVRGYPVTKRGRAAFFDHWTNQAVRELAERMEKAALLNLIKIARGE